eukprot:862020-Alexandrium_andersonii.AAC.1
MPGLAARPEADCPFATPPVPMTSASLAGTEASQPRGVCGLPTQVKADGLLAPPPEQDGSAGNFSARRVDADHADMRTSATESPRRCY